MKLKNQFFILSVMLAFCVSSCIEKKTNDPIEAYNLWGGEVPKEVKVIHGKYWQSSNWSKEYIMYLELIALPLWRSEFIKQNNLVENKEESNIPADAPNWFKPGKKFRALVHSGFSQGSIYFEDTTTGKMFIHEIQL